MTRPSGSSACRQGSGCRHSGGRSRSRPRRSRPASGAPSPAALAALETHGHAQRKLAGRRDVREPRVARRAPVDDMPSASTGPTRRWRRPRPTRRARPYIPGSSIHASSPGSSSMCDDQVEAALRTRHHLHLVRVAARATRLHLFGDGLAQCAQTRELRIVELRGLHARRHSRVICDQVRCGNRSSAGVPSRNAHAVATRAAAVGRAHARQQRSRAARTADA